MAFIRERGGKFHVVYKIKDEKARFIRNQKPLRRERMQSVASMKWSIR